MYNLDSTDTTGNSTDDAIVLLNDIDLFEFSVIVKSEKIMNWLRGQDLNL